MSEYDSNPVIVLSPEAFDALMALLDREPQVVPPLLAAAARQRRKP